MMCSREECGNSLARNLSYNECLFIFTFLAITETARLNGSWDGLHYFFVCVIGRRCFCIQLHFFTKPII